MHAFTLLALVTTNLCRIVNMSICPSEIAPTNWVVHNIQVDYAYTSYYLYNPTVWVGIIREIDRLERRKHYACNINTSS